jgi:thiol-disulfide isomerase/thioredoxin
MRQASIAVLAVLAFTIGDRLAAPAPAQAAAPGESGIFTVWGNPRPLPALRFVDGAGRPRALAEFWGKGLLLNLWATWCVPCRQEMPALDRLQMRLGGPAFEVVALSIDRAGLPAVAAFYRELGLRALAAYVDASGSAGRDLGVPGIPATLLVDTHGREVGRAFGAKAWDAPEVVREIERRLGRDPASSMPAAAGGPAIP